MKFTLVGTVLCIVVLFVPNIYSQLCGQAEYKFTVFVKDGAQAKNLRFRVYPLGNRDSPQLRDSLKQLVPYEDIPERISFPRFTRIIDMHTAEIFLKTYRESDYPKPSLYNPLGENLLSDTVKNGEFSFFTLEGGSTPYLLEVKADNMPPYYRIDNLFGGCGGGVNVNLVQKPIGDEI